MKVYVYIDESGSIHKNSNTKYFAVGGYVCLECDKFKIISKYKRKNLEVKKSREYSMNFEVKSFHYTEDEKIDIFKRVQKIDTFCGFAIIFNKDNMKKEIVRSNIFFNYAVRLIFKDCILPLFKISNILFIVSIDNRSIKIGNLKDLENYLKTEFCMENVDFHVTYYDSKINFGIQLADLIVNTFYNSYKRIEIVKKVVDTLSKSKFRISLFPEYKIIGRRKKIEYNNINNS